MVLLTRHIVTEALSRKTDRCGGSKRVHRCMGMCVSVCECVCVCVCGLVSVPHLALVCSHVAVELLSLVVRRAVGGEPDVELAGVVMAAAAAVGNAEDVHAFCLRLQNLGQRPTQTGVAALLTGSGLKELLHGQV